ncbi:glycosyltransferase family 39 protein [Sphaerisporangium sp. NPDC049002]|uniref:glycosyltransferase family 39 protein n=1 Tax=Sphaerisporangium sp. NPDC049002 TaxID=3155392 RepID=UPI0033E38F38
MTIAHSGTSVSDEDGEGHPGGLPPFAAKPVAVVAAALAALLTAFSGRYGFHRDELYFMVAGDRPAWGYIDQPPLTPLLARASTALFGQTPVGLRVAGTVLSVLTVVVVALIARELGGDRRAQTLAAVLTATSGIVIGLGHLVATATFDTLAWLVISWLVLRLLRTADGRWYLAIGAAIGIGMLNKQLVALVVVALLVSLLLVGPRRMLRTWWLLAGAAVALVLASPNLLWAAAHGWPQFTVAAGISDREGGENRLMFVPLLLVQLSPLFVPIWAAGLVRLWRDPAIRWARLFAVAVPLLVVVVPIFGGKSYYVLPLLIVAMAAGAPSVVRWAGAGRSRVLAAVIAVAALVNIVLVLPVLPPDTLRVVNAMNGEQGEQVGWPTLASTVAGAWGRIPSQQRSRAVVFAQNYGEAAAITRYGPAHGLPPAYSAHMSYAEWGPPPDSADGPVVLVYHGNNLWLPRLFGECRPAERVDLGFELGNELEEDVVQLCSGPHAPWSALWPRLRHF